MKTQDPSLSKAFLLFTAIKNSTNRKFQLSFEIILASVYASRER